MRHTLGMVAIVGCTGIKDANGTGSTGDSATSELVSLINTGTACMYGDGLPETPGALRDTTFSLGVPFDVQVELESCASGCASEVEASCSVRFVSTEVVVEASGSYRVPTKTVTCLSVCVPIVATCSGDPLDMGYWTLDYGGGHSDGFSVPGTVTSPCATAL